MINSGENFPISAFKTQNGKYKELIDLLMQKNYKSRQNFRTL